MDIKQLILFVYIINIQIMYSYELDNTKFYSYKNLTDYLVIANKYYFDTHIDTYDKNKTINKKEVLKIINHFNLSYYCKNNICVRVNRNNLQPFVEIPDEKGNIKRYISKSYTYISLYISKN